MNPLIDTPETPFPPAHTAVIVVSPDGSDQVVEVNLRTGFNINPFSNSLVNVWFSDSADGVGLTGVIPDNLSIEVGTLMCELAPDRFFMIMSDDRGLIRLRVTEATPVTWHVAVSVAHGRVDVSEPIAFPA